MRSSAIPLSSRPYDGKPESKRKQQNESEKNLIKKLFLKFEKINRIKRDFQLDSIPILCQSHKIPKYLHLIWWLRKPNK